VLICVALRSDSVERRAVLQAAREAGAGEAYTIEEPMAAAIGRWTTDLESGRKTWSSTLGGRRCSGYLASKESDISKSRASGETQDDEVTHSPHQERLQPMIGDERGRIKNLESGRHTRWDGR